MSFPALPSPAYYQLPQKREWLTSYVLRLPGAISGTESTTTTWKPEELTCTSTMVEITNYEHRMGIQTVR